MALPPSGQITFVQVCTELGISTINMNSRTMASSAIPAKSIPDGLNEFWGYAHCGDSTPAIPGSRTATRIQSGVISVSWASVSTADDYTHRRSTNGSTWTNTLTTTSTSYSTSIALGNWYWQVRSNNCAGSSSYGNMSPYPINI